MDGTGQEELYRQLVQECNDAIMFSDRQGVIRLWNKGAELMLGFSAEEAIGQSLDIFIPENQRARHWEGYYRVMETGSTRYSKDLLAAPALCKDGTRISTEFSMTIIRDAAGADVPACAARKKRARGTPRALFGCSRRFSYPTWSTR